MDNTEVAESLYRRAMGFHTQAIKVFPGTAESGPVYAPYEEYYPPDVGAAKLWLTNRRTLSWRERKEVVVMGSLEHRVRMMTPPPIHLTWVPPGTALWTLRQALSSYNNRR